jgi:hypothetical protein
MIFASVRKTVDNQSGFVLGTSLLVSAILILAGVMAIWTSNTEVQVVRNESQMKREFYDAETGIVDAVEFYNTGSTNWLTNDFLSQDPEDANNTAQVFNASNDQIADIEVRAVFDDPSDFQPVAGFSDAGNTFPFQPHIGAPPVGSGYSLKYFEIRRYAVTATSINGNTQIQVGTWMAFNKYGL